MSRSDIPVSLRQVLYLALTMFVPLLFTVALVSFAPTKPDATAASKLVAMAIVGTVVLGLIGVLVSTIRRHVVEMTQDSLVVKHSVYTLVVERREIAGIRIRQITSMDQLGLSTRKNGIAAFGYFSGWFWGLHGDIMFCAMSKWPVQLISFEGDVKCRHLALSADSELARKIEAWAAS
ncbi:hypothetical protein GJ700_24960 [Duganella sp. FT92W]|uniref:Bacterial Pleckstrin homology domain-containing protein n=1 Tax=Pseudoduganella rivuli TaxID=2666085 RepID=A0A7X2LWJ7_9BURK|nr:hypothetical protein [Pseudoduganella rivuli]MRV74969.1 hypothetical protein [Pseudoduganella rivuli]